MLDNFLIRAALAGIGVAIAAAPLGCFVVWRRMAYFGDATAHAAILGVALSLAFSTSPIIGVLIVCLGMAIVVSNLNERGMAVDTLLGVISHSALAFGLVAVSFLSGVRVDLMAYLFGDILAISMTDLVFIWVGAVIVCGIIAWRWSALLTATLNADLASSHHINPKREQLILTVALAITVAVAIKVVGALLIASLLIIPAAAARGFSKTPEMMAGLAMLIGSISVLSGIQASIIWDTPTGPTIVCCAAILFGVLNTLSRGMRG